MHDLKKRQAPGIFVSKLSTLKFENASKYILSGEDS